MEKFSVISWSDGRTTWPSKAWPNNMAKRLTKMAKGGNMGLKANCIVKVTMKRG